MPPPASNNLIQYQIEHSGYMRLLAALRFKNSSSMISNASMGRPKEFDIDMHHLETIAACLVTGKSGDVVASAFLKQAGESLTIVLAKNDAATSNDDEDAAEFLKILKDSQNQQLQDLLPFLVKRGTENIQHIVDKVRDLTNRLNKGGKLNSVIEEYCKQEGIKTLQLELPKRGQHFLNLWRPKDVKASDSGLEETLKNIIEILTAGLTLDQHEDTSSKFELLANAAATFSDSKFFEALMSGSLSYDTGNSTVGQIDKDGTELLSKFWRNLDKMRLFLRIPELMKFVQEFSSVCITWVPKSIASPKHVEEMNKIEIPSVLDVALKLAKQSMKNNQRVQSLTINDLEKKFRSWNKHWVDSKKSNNTSPFARKIFISPKLHAEVQIILYLAGLDATEGELRPVGCSKRSCLQCEIVMDLLDGGRWKTAGAHAWPYETAALIGNQYDASLRSTIKKYAIDGVQQLLGLKPARPTHVSKNSEEYVTASSSGSENETEIVIVPK